MIRKTIPLLSFYSGVIVFALFISLCTLIFISSDANYKSLSLINMPESRVAIAGKPTDKKTLNQTDTSVNLRCDATSLNDLTMCGVVFYLPQNEQQRYPSFDDYDSLTASISASSTSAYYSGKVTIFIKTVYDENNPSRDMANTKYQAVRFIPHKESTFDLQDFNVENWWLNQFDVPYQDSHRDLSDVMSVEVYISDIPLQYAGQYQLKINTLKLDGCFIHFSQFYEWMSIAWPLLIIAILLHYFVHTRVILKKSRLRLYTDKETGFFTAEKLIRDYTSLSKNNLQAHCVKVINYKSLCEKMGRKLTTQLLVSNWQRCTIEMKSNTLPIYRVSEDEFIVIKQGEPLKESSYQIVLDTCALGTTINDEGQFSLDVLIGVVPADHMPVSAQELIEKCHLVTSYAESQQQKLMYYSDDVLKIHKEELFILSCIKSSLKNQEFYLQFMPIYNADEEEVTGVEVIIRSHSEKLKDIDPENYIQVAEKYGVIKQIDLWVVEETFKTISRLCCTEKPCCRFSINISSREMLDNSFIVEFKKLIDAYKINPKYICIEITETFFVDYNAYEIRNLEELRQLGCSVSLDDFGTGFTSFPSLLKLPVNEIKIDKSYVAKLGNPKYDILIRSFIEIAQTYDYQVVAEGVENKYQLDTLIEMGCNHFQGFYISRPTDIEKVQNIGCCL
ncbi:EAL domain-containing protein [Vibrio sp.]|nr:EAL domain-containing protein [Vibrio sp.]